MATDATGTPTPKGIPKYDTANDAPSGLGFNAAMDAIDTLLGWAKARKNSAGSVLSRARFNFIEGAGIQITLGDDSTDNEIDVTIAASGGGVPSGAITAYAGASAPTDWLLCDGSAVSRSTYASLFAAIGTTYGAGDGSTTFNLPDLRGRVAVGKGSNASVDTLGENEGVSEANRRPQHRHTPHFHTVEHGQNVSNNDMFKHDSGPGDGSNNTSSADGGSGVATDPLDAPAYLVINYIIKT